MAYSEFGQRYPYYPHHQRDDIARENPISRSSKIALFSIISLLALWSGTTTFYLLFHDDALRFLAAKQTEMVLSYDAQLTVLESEVERLRSIKLLDQERVDRAVLDLTRRQASVEQRQKALANLPAPKSMNRTESLDDFTSSITPSGQVPTPDTTVTPKPSPISDTILLAPPSDRSSELHSRPATSAKPQFADIDPSDPTERRILKLAQNLDRIATRQSEALNRFEEGYDDRETRLRTVFADLIVAVPAPSLARQALAIGGPLLPFGKSSDPFEQQITRVRNMAGTIENLDGLLNAVPVRRPVPRGAEVTSGFGVRVDPFIRTYAMHSGVDFRGEPGDPARATAAGRVTVASFQGGYGLMVEIDHGNGLATRYGHLSVIGVTEGQWVQAGESVGRIGTTGRSTGPHLHYEVRVAGEAIDPQRYLRAGVRLEAPSR
jgi:murein DD-endopeptidase MepM/ murein hydrolase activator NlpD